MHRTFLLVPLALAVPVSLAAPAPLLLPTEDAPAGRVGLSFVSRGTGDVGAGLWLAASLRNPGVQGLYARWLAERGQLDRAGAIRGLHASGLAAYLDRLAAGLPDFVSEELTRASLLGEATLSDRSFAAVRALPPFEGLTAPVDSVFVRAKIQDVRCGPCPAGEGPHMSCHDRAGQCVESCHGEGQRCQSEVVPAP